MNTLVAATYALLTDDGKVQVRSVRWQDFEAVRADAARIAVERRPGGYACASSNTVRAHPPFAWAAATDPNLTEVSCRLIQQQEARFHYHALVVLHA